MKLSDDERARIRAALESGQTVTQAARSTGFSRNTVVSIADAMRAAGVTIARDPRGRKRAAA